MKNNNSMYQFVSELFPICRSITGDGVRETLDAIQKHVPIKINEVSSGTKVFDWTVPHEWNIKDAYVRNSDGEKVIDFKKNNLHVVNYSIPVDKKVSLEELKKHIFTLPDKPEWIPYRTSYYEKSWGFCMAHKDFLKLKEGEYEVFIDSTLKKGNLTYGEYYIKGKVDDEVLISTHVCHPSMANDNLSGTAVATFLAKYLTKKNNHYSYRFLFIPGTIGSISWLSLNQKRVSRIKYGLVLTGVGDSGSITYKKSRQGVAEIDKITEHVLKYSGKNYQIVDFHPFGYDERQYCSPGFNLPVGTFMRTPHGQYPEYHTSADNLGFLKPESLQGSLSTIIAILDVIENNRTYLNLNPKCEPQLGKRGLYKAMNAVGEDRAKLQLALLWVLNLSDGDNSLLDVAERSGFEFSFILKAANLLFEKDLLKGVKNGKT